MIGIIAAIDLEVAEIRVYFNEQRVLDYKGVRFWTAKIGNTEVCLAKCGVGKVNASYTATLMIERFEPKAIISSGIAGGLNCLSVLDVLVADKLCQHDIDVTAFGDEYGFIDRLNKVYLTANDKIVKILTKVTADAKIGTLATGDQFIASDERSRFIREVFNAFACDMESGAIAQVCELANIPFGVVRVISDGGNDQAKLTFEQFKEKAAKKSSQIVAKAVEEIEKLQIL